MRVQSSQFGGQEEGLRRNPGPGTNQDFFLCSIPRADSNKWIKIKNSLTDSVTNRAAGNRQSEQRPKIRHKILSYAFLWGGVLLAGMSVGCASWTHTDRGALTGGLLGAGSGALIGSSTGHAGAGAILGAGLGTLAGALVGSELDEVEAKNRAMIAQQLGRPVGPGAVSMEDVVAMTQAGVAEELIVNHIRANGVQRPLTANDIILLQQQGVSIRAIAAMQEAVQARPPAQAVPVVPAAPPSVPVIVEEYHYGPWGPPYWWRRYHYPPPPRGGFSWGIAVGN